MIKRSKTKNQKKESSQPVLSRAEGIERRFGVILENIDSKIDLVVEGHKALDKKIDKNHQEFQEFRGEVNYKFEVVFDKFTEIDKKFIEVDKRFDEVTGELRIIRHELKEKVGRDEFIMLEKRVAELEKSRR